MVGFPKYGHICYVIDLIERTVICFFAFCLFFFISCEKIHVKIYLSNWLLKINNSGELFSSVRTKKF